MIMDHVLEMINKIFLSFFQGWEDIDLLISSSVYETLSDIFAFLFYILPMDGIVTIVGLFISIMGLRILISLIKTLWQLLPIL